MSYGLIYTVPFATLDNASCVVEIEKEGFTGKPKELMPAGDSPFTIDIEDEEFLYTPTRFSTATIRVVGNDYLQSLFSTAYQMYRVTFKKDGVITWCGFIKPELYTQDYTSKTFELELECMSAMSSLEFIDYKQAREDERAFVSLWDLLKKFISLSSGKYNTVYLPHVYAKNSAEYISASNVLEEMTISEQNFFDEDDKPMKLKEVLEEVCKFLNWTCVDWRGDLYFVDIDHIGEYYKYNLISFEKNDRKIVELFSIQDIGFRGSEHSLDILPGYNKAVVKCSNYCIGEINIYEDFEKLKLLSNIGDVSTSIGNGKTRYTYRDVLIPNKLELKQFIYKEGKLSQITNLSDFKDNNQAAELLGAIPLRYATYESSIDSPNVQSYNYEHVIQVRQRSGGYSNINDQSFESVFNDSVVVMRSKNDGLFFSKDGALCLSMSIKVLQKDKSVVPFGGGLIPSEDGITYMKDKIKVCIRIGDKYVMQNNFGIFVWTDTPSTFLVNLEQANVENAEGKMGTGFVPLHKTYGVIGKFSEADGCIIEIPEILMGTLEMSIYAPVLAEREKQVPYGYVIKDLKLKYCPPIFADSDDNSDRIYENVVNENYINELDEIEFKISSYNNDGACYSKVILGDEYLTNNLYSAIEETTIRPEEQLIRRIIKRYSAPRIKLTQVIKETSDLTPITRLSDNYMVNKKFINAGGTIDFKMNQFQCIMIEV